jgi:hypothetical protein
MSGSESRFDDVVVDTVVVNYFLAVGRFSLLATILGGHVNVPRAIYDPDDAERVDESSISELEQGLRRHRRRAGDMELAQRQRERSREALPHFERLPEHVGAGSLVPLSLEPAEIQLFAMFRDPSWARTQGRLVELGFGEAAVLAIAESRGLRIATDDGDCIEIARERRPAFAIMRIRGLLTLAVEAGLVGLDEARSIHLAMISAGFWDTGRL